MKILQINNYHYLRGGSDKVYLDTSQLLKSKGHKVINFSVRDSKNLTNTYSAFFIRPVNFFKGGFFKKIVMVLRFVYSFESKDHLEKLIKKERPDIAHVHIYHGRLTSSIMGVLRKYNIPIVMTLHEYRMLCPVYTFLDNKKNICEKCAHGNYMHCFLNKCCKNNRIYSLIMAVECFFRDLLIPSKDYIDKFIMVSKFSMKKHLHYIPSIKDKAGHIYNFFDDKRYRKSKHPKHFYVYFGRLSKE